MSESRELHALRTIAWERGKCELRSMLLTFYPDYTPNYPEEETSYHKLSTLIKDFIESVEEEGLHE